MIRVCGFFERKSSGRGWFRGRGACGMGVKEYQDVRAKVFKNERNECVKMDLRGYETDLCKIT